MNGWFNPAKRRRQRVRFVRVNGRDFKRVICADRPRASAIAGTLEAFGPSPHLPRLIWTCEREVWVTRVPGRPFAASDGSALSRIHELYATFYGHRAYRMPVGETPFPQRLHRDLRVLYEIGAIDPDAFDRLAAWADALTPSEVWLGFDYMDARLENFVWSTAGPAVGIDVENVTADTLLGCGLASARMHWADSNGPALGAILSRAELAHVAPAFPFAELAYRAQTVKRRLLKKGGRGRWATAQRTLEAVLPAHEPSDLPGTVQEIAAEITGTAG